MPGNWNSGCPAAYFPLDANSEGTAYGNDPTAIDFSQPGQVGNGLSFVNPSGNLNAAFRLHGTFVSPDYCFTTPDTCPDGFTMGFWMNILGQHGGSLNQAVLSRKPSVNGLGFRIFWKKNQGLYIEINRVDSVEEKLIVKIADYPSSNSFGVWYHYAMSYKFDGNNPSNVFNLYLDGAVLSGLDKSASSVGNPDANTGSVDIAKNDNTITTGDDAHMKFDELVFWERLLACDDPIRLYKGF